MASRTILVGTQGGAQAATLASALAIASSGDTLLVSAGVYEETVHFAVDVTVSSAPVSEGESGADVSRAIIIGAVVITADVTLTNIEVRGMVDVRKGRATLDRCEVHHGSDGLRAHPSSVLTVRNSRVHHCSGGGDGVYFMSGASGELSETDIFDCRVNGVHVQGSTVAVRDNRIRDCTFGLYYEKAAAGLCERNTVEHVRKFGIYITDDSAPTVCGNTVRECGLLCFFASKGGRGLCSGNTFEGSIHVLAACQVQLSENTTTGNTDVDVVLPVGIAA